MPKDDYPNEKAFLAAYDIHDYKVPLTLVDMAIFTIKDDALCVLLVKRAQYPKKGRWALPGGFIDINKDAGLEDTARRKLHEKTGVDTAYLEQVVTLGNKKRDPRGWSVTVVYFALINADDVSLSADASSEEVNWVAVDEVLDGLKLAFDHEHILRCCLERLKSKVQYTSIPIHLLPRTFTLSELQHVFELLLGANVEKKAFRRRILDAGILRETGGERVTGRRPAKLYTAIESSGAHFFPRVIEGRV